MNFGFTKSKVDSNIYYKIENDEIMILLLYVDDLFFIEKEKLIKECKKKLAVEFEMKGLGTMRYLLGLEVWEFPDVIFLNQGRYTIDILKRFGMLY